MLNCVLPLGTYRGNRFFCFLVHDICMNNTYSFFYLIMTLLCRIVQMREADICSPSSIPQTKARKHDEVNDFQ